jgi:hypothetical protein
VQAALLRGCHDTDAGASDASLREASAAEEGRPARQSPELPWNLSQHEPGLASGCSGLQPREPRRDRPPPGQRGKQAVDCLLGRFSDRFVDHRVQRNDLSDKFASDRLCVRRWINRGQSGAETDGNFGRQNCKKARQPTRSNAEIGTSKNKNNAGAYDADPDLTEPNDGEGKGLAIGAACRAKRASPVRIAELKPERDIEGEAD